MIDSYIGRGTGYKGRAHTPFVTLLKIVGVHCEELVLWQEHSDHVVAEAHLRDRYEGNGWKQRSADGAQRRASSLEAKG